MFYGLVMLLPMTITVGLAAFGFALLLLPITPLVRLMRPSPGVTPLLLLPALSCDRAATAKRWAEFK